MFKMDSNFMAQRGTQQSLQYLLNIQQRINDVELDKGTVSFLPQTQIFSFIYLCNPMVLSFIIRLIYLTEFTVQKFTTMNCKDIGIKKSEFVKKKSVPSGHFLARLHK